MAENCAWRAVLHNYWHRETPQRHSEARAFIFPLGGQGGGLACKSLCVGLSGHSLLTAFLLLGGKGASATGWG